MIRINRLATASAFAAAVLSSTLLLVPPAAHAADPPTADRVNKAQVEHHEHLQLAARNKAQIEHDERLVQWLIARRAC